MGMPVDLNAESSSVSSLSGLPLRKSHVSASASATSTDSGTSMPQPLGLGLTLGIGLGIGLGAEMDAGYCTQFDSHSNSPSHGSHVPHPSHQTTESPPVAPRTRVPLY